MPIFDHPKLGRTLFIHVPKTGGSSVFWWLKNSGFHLERLATDKMPHPLHVDYREWGNFDYKFMVVREPIERFCSILRYRQEPTRGGVKNEDMDAFAIDALDKVTAKGYRKRGSLLDDVWNGHIPPQVAYYCDDVEVFKFEDGFETLREKLDLDVPIPHVNISSGEVNVSHLSDTTISRVKEYYKEDYKTFGY